MNLYLYKYRVYCTSHRSYIIYYISYIACIIIGNASISYCTNLYKFILISYELTLTISHDLGFVSLNCLLIIPVYLVNFLILITLILGCLPLLILLLALTLSLNSYSILLVLLLFISATLSISLYQ